MRSLILILCMCSSAYARPLKMTPGLWSVSMVMKDGAGNDVSATKQLEAALAKMPKEKRKEVEAMMGKLGSGGVGPGKDGILVCYSKEMINDPEAVVQYQNKQCDNKILSQTDAEVKTSFTCKDGTKGNGIWRYKAQSYNGILTMDSPKRGKSTMTYTAKFVSSDCGKVKPLEARK